jgi:hypothetical protein
VGLMRALDRRSSHDIVPSHLRMRLSSCSTPVLAAPLSPVPQWPLRNSEQQPPCISACQCRLRKGIAAQPQPQRRN